MGDRSALLADFHTFGDLLKYLRRRAQLTQRELSIAVGYSESQISRLEANLRLPDRASLLALFIPALSIQEEPETINRLLELAQPDQPKPTSKDPANEPGLRLSTAETTHPHNLPIQLTSFIGREAEITALRQIITAGPTRLVTLTGSGGVGKTRLAIRAAEGALDDFVDGVWLVELAPLADPELVALATITALGLAPTPGQTAAQLLCDHLRIKRLLLILDNCEHVVNAVAELADRLLRACPYLRILATSREILGVSGEMPFRCPSLSLPDPQHLPPVAELAHSEAVCLFVQRAQTAAAGFSLTEANAALIARVCQRLDGIPLAIELAAARMSMLTTEQLAQRLENAFRLLTGGSRTALPRQQTLRATIDWSHNLLSHKERVVLRRLSVFAGGTTLEAAEAVCVGEGIVSDEILDMLSSLINKSIVIAERNQRQELRYRLLEMVRQYAREKLFDAGESERLRDCHLDYFQKLSVQAEPHLRGKGQRLWLDRLDVDLGNLRLALEWALVNDIEKGLQIAAALEWFWHIRSHWLEGIGWLERLLAAETGAAADAASGGDPSKSGNQPRPPARSIARGKALNALVKIRTNWVGNENVVPLLEEARAIFDEHGDLNQRDLANSLALLATTEKDLDRAITGIQHALDLLRQAGDDFLITDYLFYLATQNVVKGDFAQARANAEECIARARAAEDVESEGAYLALLGQVELISGNPHQTTLLLEEARSCFDRSGNRFYSVSLMDVQALVAMSQGDYWQAAHLTEAVLAFSIEKNEKGMLLEAINLLGWEAWALKDYDQATRQGEKGLDLARELRPTLGITAESNAITAEYILGRVALSRGEYSRADAYLKALILSMEVKNEPIWNISFFWSPFGFKGIAYEAINALGVLASAQHQARRAATLFGAQAELYDWQKNILSLAWRAGREMTPEQAVAYAVEDQE